MARTTAYKPKGITTQISATYRISTKIHDNFHTVEYTEQRQIPDVKGVNIEKEKEALWDAVIVEIENQIDDIVASYNQL